MSKKCKIPARTLGPCDLEWGHDGEMHASEGDGFYNRDYEEEHKQRQRIIREARCGVKSKQGLTCGMKKGHKGKKHNALAWAVYPPPDGPLR